MKDDDQDLPVDTCHIKGRHYIDEKKKLPSPIQPSLLYMAASLPKPLQYVRLPKLKQPPISDPRLKNILSITPPLASSTLPEGRYSREPDNWDSNHFITQTSIQKNSKESSIFNHSIPLLLEKEENKDKGENSRRYNCPICQKKFLRPSSLKIHIYSHTGEKPYPCTFPGCERRFSVHSNMKRHLRVHPSSRFST